MAAGGGGGAGKVVAPLGVASVLAGLLGYVVANSGRGSAQPRGPAADAQEPAERTYRLSVSRHVHGLRNCKWEYRLRARVRDVEHFQSMVLKRAGISDELITTFIAYHVRWHIETKDGRRVTTATWVKATEFSAQSRWRFVCGKDSYVEVRLE
jgi:hypothetical protein